MPFCIGSAMPVDAGELEEAPLKLQLPAGASAAAEKLVSFWVNKNMLAIFLLFSGAFCAVPVFLAVVLVGLRWG